MQKMISVSCTPPRTNADMQVAPPLLKITTRVVTVSPLPIERPQGTSCQSSRVPALVYRLLRDPVLLPENP
ncbi:unnamed protein product [Fusarium graminearum]|nr:unnamed protein product [Fusarium graminearum]